MSVKKNALCLILISFLSLAACGSPDEKRDAFFHKGKALYEAKDYVRARLELKNALQIDSEFADAYLLLGKLEQEVRDVKKAYGYLLKAVKLAPDNIDARVALGRLLVGGRGFDQAMEQAEEILKRAPDNVDGAMMKAAVHLAKQEFDAADALLKALEARGVTQPDLYLMRSAVAKAKEDADGAYHLIEKGLQMNPDAVPLLLTMAQLEAGRGHDDVVVRLLKKTISLAPGNDGFRMNLAGFYLGKDREADAVAVMDAILTRGADDAADGDMNAKDKSGIVAAFWLKNNRPDQALSVLEKAMAASPERADVRNQLSEIYLAQNKREKAREVLEGGLAFHGEADDPDRINLQTALAQLSFREGNRDDARTRIDEVLAHDPKNVKGHLIRGNLLLADKDAAQAVADFRVVVSDHPELIEGHVGLARAHAMAGDLPLAVDVLKSTLNERPDAKPLVRALVEIHLLAGDAGAARAVMENDVKRRLKASPDDPDVQTDLDAFLTLLVRYHFAKGVPEAAEALCRDYPENSACWNALGNLHEQNRQYDAAMAAYSHIWERNPKAWDAANNMAFLMVRKDPSPVNLEQALVLAEQALSLNPGSPYILDTIGWIQYHQGDLSRAKETLGIAAEQLEKHPVVAYHMGMILHALGERDRARAWFEKVVETPGEFEEKAAAQKMLTD